MPFLAQVHVDIPNKDILSWMFDNPQYDIDKPIYIDAANPNRSISCRQAKNMVRRLAAGFRKAGLQKGDCVCIHSFNDISYCMVFLGIVAAGGIFTGTNPAYTSHELAHAIQTAKIKFFVTESALLTNVNKAASDNGISNERIFVFDGVSRDAAEYANNNEVNSWKWLTQHGEEDWERFDDYEKCKRTAVARLFSSGTTGLPKALDMTHYNFVSMEGRDDTNHCANGRNRLRNILS